MSAVEELDSLLQSLRSLKPPGVTKSKIDLITSVCMVNIRDESLLAQKIFTHFKKTPPTHKLGIMYAVDSVTRQWVEKARQAGQNVANGAAEDGTYAAGVHRMTELLPTMMNELVQLAPDDQKEKIKKLIDIWEKGSTFPQRMLSDFRQKILQPTSNSFTPPGSPPGNVASGNSASQNGQKQDGSSTAKGPAPAADAGAILAALANLGKQTAVNSTPNQVPAQNIPTPTPTYQPNTQPQVNPSVPQLQQPLNNFNPPANPQPGNVNAAPPPFGMVNSQMPQNVPNMNPLATLPMGQQPPHNMAPASDAYSLQMQLVQGLASGQVPQEQIPQVLAALGVLQNSAAPPMIPPMNAGMMPQLGGGMSRDDQRQPYDTSRYRDRSRSPDGRYRRGSPPHRRDSPTYGTYDPVGSNAQFDRRGRVKGRNYRNDFRQRSPISGIGMQSPDVTPRPQLPKWVEYDYNLPDGHIKVLSRTLFVGGVTGTEMELRSIFSSFGGVQSCIVNHEKRHAFVKMVSRNDALAAKDGMEKIRDPEILGKARSTRWGVGFGPRECSDYNSGVSIIPIDCLTDADRKWMVSAEYGGTGGKGIEPGLVVEEPDIEIGAGVSSKAISRRVGPEQGGSGSGGGGNRRGGNNGTPRAGYDGSASRFRRPEGRPESPRQDQGSNVGVAPAVPGFGFQIPGMPPTQFG